MAILSVMLRLVAILAAAGAVTVYILGGNKLKETQSLYETQLNQNQQLRTSLEEKDQLFQKTKDQLDSTTMELATFKRDKRVTDSEILLVKQELQKTQEQVERVEAAKTALVEENDELRRETINLKAQGFDPSSNPKLLTAQIDEQRGRIHELESELDDAQTVIRGLFKRNPSNSDTLSSTNSTSRQHLQQARIQRNVKEHNILVLEAGSTQGIQTNKEFTLLKGGAPVAKVRAARVMPDLCIVNVLTTEENGERLLMQGAHIEYTL